MKTPRKFATKIVWNMETLAIIERVPYAYSGPVALCKASSQETGIQSSTADFYKTLTSDYSKQFAGQSAIISQLRNSFAPILAGGVGQKGFSPAEEADLKTQAMNANAAEYQKSAQAAGNALAARGGGNTFLPSGGEAQIKSEIANEAARSESAANLGIDVENYRQGRENFMAAAGQLGSAANMLNPTGYAGVAGTEGSNAFSEASSIAQQNDTFGQIAGIVGGAASSWLGGGGGNPFAKKGG